ncbi:hypothetical protein [Streptosporangium canum]|uniref:hypothetical protein n=1 Tax=Streptosporangium canum TaxID=324952 RepID=UPI0037B478B7
MAKRIDFFDEPNAPKANSLVPLVNVIVTNDAGDILPYSNTAIRDHAPPARIRRLTRQGVR